MIHARHGKENNSMAIISISRGCFSHGKTIAEKIAQKLNYECVDRVILLEAVEFFNISETKLLHSVNDAPGVLNKITHGREKYLAYFQAALLEHVKHDNVVYHGHAGHLLLPNLSHIMKVRIIADMADRINFMQQEDHISAEEAQKRIKKDDRERANWTRYLYNRDIQDPSLYDMVINIATFSIDDACDMICHAINSGMFKTKPEDKQTLNDYAISCCIKAALQELCEPEVSVHNGILRIQVPPGKIRKSDFSRADVQSQLQESIKIGISNEIKKIAHRISDVKHIVIDVDPPELL